MEEVESCSVQAFLLWIDEQFNDIFIAIPAIGHGVGFTTQSGRLC
jgi:hypothetical protein